MVVALTEFEAPPLAPAPAPSRRSARLVRVAVVGLDGAAVAAAQALVWAMTPAVTRAAPGVALAALVSGPAWLTSLARRGAYRTQCIRDRGEEHRRIRQGAMTTTTFLLALAVALGAVPDGRWLAVLVATQVAALLLARSVSRRVLRLRRTRGLDLEPVAIVGDNDEATALAVSLVSDPTLGYAVVGMLEPDVATVAAVRELGATGVVVATTAVEQVTSNTLARRLSDAGLHVELSSSLRDLAARRLSVCALGPFSTLHVEPVRRGGWRATAKRAFDMAGATAVLVLLAPALAAIAVAVKLTSPGPVIFRQERVGQHGAPFAMLKFRTMFERSEAMVIDLRGDRTALFKPAVDPRVTPVGRILRKLSLDELPQLWNVLQGTMSLVGPRPALADEMAMWSSELYDRLRVRPGITGLWQVDREDWSIEHYARLDLHYVDNWSLRTDLAIVGRTIPAVLFKRANR